jgi:hypothetical protein
MRKRQKAQMTISKAMILATTGVVQVVVRAVSVVHRAI